MANVITAVSFQVASVLPSRRTCFGFKGKTYYPVRCMRELKTRMRECSLVCKATEETSPAKPLEEGFISNGVLQVVLWSMTGVYVLWLFILPYAPGEPAWAIDAKTVSMLLDLSLSFFLILPLVNAAGFHVLEAPVIHPTSEALFNLVMAWTLLFGPVLFSDLRSNRFKGSLETLWLGQWLLTNAFLIPYMAIRLNSASSRSTRPSSFRSAVLAGSRYVAVVGVVVAVLSLAWGAAGRGEGFGGLDERWKYFVEYVRTDRVAYAFVWDLVLYSVFQPWLVHGNLTRIKNQGSRTAVELLRFLPIVGMTAYLWALESESEPVDGKNE